MPASVRYAKPRLLKTCPPPLRAPFKDFAPSSPKAGGIFRHSPGAERAYQALPPPCVPYAPQSSSVPACLYGAPCFRGSADLFCLCAAEALPLLPVSEDGGSDADDGGTLADGLGIISAHAHGEFRHGHAPKLLHLPAQIPKSSEDPLQHCLVRL